MQKNKKKIKSVGEEVKRALLEFASSTTGTKKHCVTPSTCREILSPTRSQHRRSRNLGVTAGLGVSSDICNQRQTQSCTQGVLSPPTRTPCRCELEAGVGGGWQVRKKLWVQCSTEVPKSRRCDIAAKKVGEQGPGQF